MTRNKHSLEFESVSCRVFVQHLFADTLLESSCFLFKRNSLRFTPLREKIQKQLRIYNSLIIKMHERESQYRSVGVKAMLQHKIFFLCLSTHSLRVYNARIPCHSPPPCVSSLIHPHRRFTNSLALVTKPFSRYTLSSLHLTNKKRSAK